MQARWLLAQCDRFKCLPSALLAEDSVLMRMLAIEEVMGSGERNQDQGYDRQ